MPVNIKITDEREQKDKPSIAPDDFKIQPVLDFADIVTKDDEELTIEVVLHNGKQEGELRTPTSLLSPGTKKELYELELTDAKSGETVKVWQEREVPDENSWKINILILPKEELGFGGMRALSRAISREVFAISTYRAYGDMIAAMYPTPKDFVDAQTKFADDAPWAVS